MHEHIGAPNTACVQRARILEHLKHDKLTTLQARSMGIMHPGHRVARYRLVVAGGQP